MLLPEAGGFLTWLVVVEPHSEVNGTWKQFPHDSKAWTLGDIFSDTIMHALLLGNSPGTQFLHHLPPDSVVVYRQALLGPQ